MHHRYLRLYLFSLLLAFACSAWAGTTLHFDSKDGVARMPFTFDASHIFVQVTLSDGKTAEFLVDTGADFTILNTGFARDTGIKGSGESSIHSAAGSVSMSNAPEERLRLPGLEIEEDNLVVMDLGHLEPLAGHRIDGVLGNDVLSECAVRIDYAAGEISFYRSDAYTPPDQAVALPLAGKMFTNAVFVPVTLTLPGKPPEQLRFAIDSGASYSSLNSPYVDSSGAIQAVGKTMTRQAFGADNTRIDFLVGRAAGLALGPYLLTAPILQLYRGKGGVFASDNFQGVLGNDVLKRFTVTLDYPDKKLVLEPNAGFRAPFQADASGLTLKATGDDLRGVEVLAVDPQTPAAEAKVQPGDAIDAVDGTPVARLRLGDIKQTLTQDGKDVRLDVRRGGKRLQLTLKLRKLI